MNKQQCLRLPYKCTHKRERVKKSKFKNKAKATIALPNDRGAEGSAEDEDKHIRSHVYIITKG